MTEYNNIDSSGKRINLIDSVLFCALLMVSAAAMLLLFYRQGISEGGSYLSDIKPYIEEMLGTQTVYSFPYPVMFKTAWIINLVAPSPEWAMAIAVTLFNVLAFVVTKIAFDRLTDNRLLSTIGTFSLFFASMLFGLPYGIPGFENRYVGVFSINPWHNATYMAARPFMILAFLYGAKTLDTYEGDFKDIKSLDKNSIGNYLLFALFIFLVTVTKPSYTIVHMAAFGTIMIYRWIKNKCATFKQSLLLGACYVPTILALLYQYLGVFTTTTSSAGGEGIGFGWLRVWHIYTASVPVVMLRAGLFPLLVLLFNYKKLVSDSLYRYSWIVYLSGFLMAAGLYEKGFRESHFNFGWGYGCGLFMLFFTAIIVLIRETMKQDKTKAGIICLGMEWIALIMHRICGIYYFMLLSMGRGYL